MDEARVILCCISLMTASWLVLGHAHQHNKYDFGYSIQDKYGNRQHRQEKSDHTGAKIGSYGYTDRHGIYRYVDYIADHKGFRAIVRTNEPGTSNDHPADVQMLAENSPSHTIQQSVVRSKKFAVTYAPTRIYSRAPVAEYPKADFSPNRISTKPVYPQKYRPRYVSTRIMDDLARLKKPHDRYSYVIAKDQGLQSAKTTDLPLYRDK